jgi:hypothetical protein
MSGDLDAIPPDVAGAAARVADAADDRRRLREARNRNAGRTSMRDVLVGAAERSSTVTLVLGHGRSHRVQVVAVGADAVVAAPVGGGHEADRRLLVGLAAVRTIVVHRADATVAGAGWVGPEALPGDARQDATAVQEFHMSDILSQRLADRPRITVWLGPDQMSGTLTSVGLDVATIATEGSGETAYVRLDSTTEISVSSSL